MDGLTRLALAGGAFVGLPFTAKPPMEDPEARKEPRFSASFNGFDVHCAVRVAAKGDEGRERLIRYCARPPFSLERIEELKDGRIGYLMKTSRRGRTHRVMTPMEFMGRLAILVPPPFYPLVRYHGVFGARSKWRPLVTMKPPSGARPKKAKPCPDPAAEAQPADAAPVATLTSTQPVEAASPSAPPAAAPATASASRTRPSIIPSDDPTTLTIAHWGRLLDGELFASSSRVDWAVLLQRTFGFEALRCPKCEGKMRIVATVTNPASVERVLTHLGVRTEPLPRARARDPTGQTAFGFDAA